ncbi:Chaoptin isoform X1 [Aphelenchoides fujianensis]|nr:Chaoptin isoform X1 [Aphelenchoides fujianensis]
MNSLHFLLFLSISAFATGLATFHSSKRCQEIEAQLRTPDGKSPCGCAPRFHGGQNASEEVGDVEIVCRGATLPEIFAALRSPPEVLEIRRLSIWNSQMTSLPAGIFAKVRPQDLSISLSSLATIRPHAFDEIADRLHNLTLNGNLLQDVYSSTFQLPVLQHLSLANNKLEALDLTAFRGMPFLRTIRLQKNRIRNILPRPGYFFHLKHVELIDLSDNRIETVGRLSSNGLPALKTLNLANNRISRVGKYLHEDAPASEELNLNNNTLQNISLSNLPNLRRLSLNRNQFAEWKKIELLDLPMLHTLQLDKNRLSSIQNGDLGRICTASSLRSLYSNNNTISEIGIEAFSSCTHLRSLFLDHNRLESLRGRPRYGNATIPWLYSLKELEYFSAAFNRLSTLRKGDLNAGPNLRQVLLDHNEIESVEKGALDGLKLDLLFLQNNRLRSLPAGLFDGLNTKDVLEVNLQGNNFSCTCNDSWIARWYQQFESAAYFFDCRPETFAECPTPSHPLIAWLGALLAICSLIFLVLIGLLHFKPNKWIKQPLNGETDEIQLIGR